jgi:hypothetical protein
VDPIRGNFTWAGYDYGYCSETEGLFSVIFNEVIFGHYPQLAHFTMELNKQYLLERREDVLTLQLERQKLENTRADLETGQMEPWSVWVYANTSWTSPELQPRDWVHI